MKVEIEFEFFLGQGWPELIFLSEVDQLSIQITDLSPLSKRVVYQFLTNHDQITIRNNNKTENDTVVVDGKIVQDQIVKLQKIWVDNILLDTDLILNLAMYRNEFSQDYFDYCAQQQLDPEPVETHWHTWYFNGIWQWQFEQPFWGWYCQQRQNKQKLGLTKEQVELYVGTGTDKHQLLMQQLKTLLQP